MLLLTHATLFNKDFNLGDINIKKVFTMESSWINKEVQYMKTNKEAFKNTLEIIEFCEQQTIFKKINCDKLKENLENIATSTILLSLSNIRKYKNERKGEIGNNSDDMFMYFISENEVAIKYLIDIKSKVFSEIVDEEMIKDIESITNKRDGFSEIERGLKYLFINRSVDQQDNQEKTKSKKLKI